MQERLRRESSSSRAAALAPFPSRMRRPYLRDADPSLGLPLEVYPSLVAAHPPCAESRTLRERVRFTEEDLMALEASARTMSDIQSFIFWVPGGVVHLLQGLLPADLPQRRLSAGMCDILALAMSHLSGEVASRTALRSAGVGSTTCLSFRSRCTRWMSSRRLGLRL